MSVESLRSWGNFQQMPSIVEIVCLLYFDMVIPTFGNVFPIFSYFQFAGQYFWCCSNWSTPWSINKMERRGYYERYKKNYVGKPATILNFLKESLRRQWYIYDIWRSPESLRWSIAIGIRPLSFDVRRLLTVLHF